MADENVVLQEIAGSVQNIGENRKRKSDHKITKFLSLAEGMEEFQRDIRGCFRSKSRKIGGENKNYSFRLTIPQSPMLLSKTRTRPVNYPSAEERAQKEIESFKFKAKPVNKKIFDPPQLGRRFPRAPLVVEPFNLTEYKRKETKESSPFQFKAKGMPKGMNGKLAALKKSPAHTNVTMVKTPDITVPQLFSFEERDKLMMKNKEEKIKMVLQKEKEERIFCASPVPTYIKKMYKREEQ